MNINGYYGNISTTPTTNIAAVNTSSARTSSVPPAVGGAATATISTPGQFFSDLQQLSEQDPTKFKAVAAQLATSFQNAASQASGPQAKFLGNLANQFNQASQTGSLQPPQGSQAAQPSSAAVGAQTAGGPETHHHHHHHGGGSMASGGQSSEVQQAFQNAMGILTQALQATTSPSSSSSSPST